MWQVHEQSSFSVRNRVEAVQRSPWTHPAVADDSSQTEVGAGTSPPPLRVVVSGEKEGRTPSSLLFVIGQIFYSSHVEEEPVSFVAGGVCVMSSPTYCRAALPLHRAGRAVIPPLLLLGLDSLSVARLDDLPQQGVLRQMRKVKLMPAHAACLSGMRQKPKPRTVCSESPWQRIPCCYATQETREGESCDPVMVISLAQIKIRFKIKKKLSKQTKTKSAHHPPLAPTPPENKPKMSVTFCQMTNWHYHFSHQTYRISHAGVFPLGLVSLDSLLGSRTQERLKDGREYFEESKGAYNSQLY